MRGSEIINAIRPATLAEKGRAFFMGVADGQDVAIPFFCLDTFGRNGARLFLTPSVDITAWGFAIFIQRTFTP